MLRIEDVRQNIAHGIFGPAVVEHFQIALFPGKKIDPLVDGPDPRLVQLPLAGQDRLRGCRQKNIVVERRNEQTAEPIEEYGIQIDAAPPAVADDIGIITVEDDEPCQTNL